MTRSEFLAELRAWEAQQEAESFTFEVDEDESNFECAACGTDRQGDAEGAYCEHCQWASDEDAAMFDEVDDEA